MSEPLTGLLVGVVVGWLFGMAIAIWGRWPKRPPTNLPPPPPDPEPVQRKRTMWDGRN